MTNRESHRVRRSEDGATLVTFALSLVAICTVIALVIGGSLGYSAERNSQTASDAAALAATTTLRNVQTKGIASSQVLATAQQVAVANGANAADVTCDLVAVDGSEIGDCGSASSAQFMAASGVRVGTSDTREVPFGRVAGKGTITGTTDATATIQPLAEGRSPFMVCAPAPAHPAEVLNYNESTDEYSINEDAIGKDFVLQGNPMKEGGRDCGNPSQNWRGWVDFDNTFEIPGEWAVEDGNKNGHIPRQLAGDNACGGQGTDVNDFIGCHIAVPLCTSGNGEPGNNFRTWCVAVGAFEIVHNGNGPSVCSDQNSKHICGRFEGAAVATGGQGTDEQAGLNEVVVIKLVD